MDLPCTEMQVRDLPIGISTLLSTVCSVSSSHGREIHTQYTVCMATVCTRLSVPVRTHTVYTYGVSDREGFVFMAQIILFGFEPNMSFAVSFTGRFLPILYVALYEY